jgi:hypothetical protein
LDDPLADYPYKTQEEIEKLIKKGRDKKLRDLSQHKINNAWYKLRFHLKNKRGIHGATPSEMLHALLLGLFKYFRDAFFEHIGKDSNAAKDINGLAMVYCKFFSRQSDRALPATSFSKGIQEGKLMAKEFRGVLFLIATIIRSSKGRQILDKNANFKGDASKKNWLQLVERLLTWEAYLNQPRMLRRHVKRLSKKNRWILYEFKKVAPRITKNTMALKIIKFHDKVHMADDILLFGVPQEVDTGPNESHHKPTKHAAQLTQRNELTFDEQTAQRLDDFRVMHLGLEEINNQACVFHYYRRVSQNTNQPDVDTNQQDVEMVDETPTTSLGGTLMEVAVDKTTHQFLLHVHSKGKFSEQFGMDNDLIRFLLGLQDKTSDYLPDKFLQIRTDHK